MVSLTDDACSESWHPFTFSMKFDMEVGDEIVNTRAAPMDARPTWMLAMAS